MRYGSLNNLFNAILERKRCSNRIKGNEKLSEQIYKVVKKNKTNTNNSKLHIKHKIICREWSRDSKNILTDAENMEQR